MTQSRENQNGLGCWHAALNGMTAGLSAGQPLTRVIQSEVVRAENLEDAMSVIQECFSREDDVRSARAAYERFISGEYVYDSEFSGTKVELITYSLYRVDGRPAAVSGAYRLLNDPDRLYMGWLGSPEFRKTNLPDVRPLSEIILDDTIALALQRGATAVAAVAENAESNQNTHRYYERHGFKIERIFERNGEIDRLYVLGVPQGARVWLAKVRNSSPKTTRKILARSNLN